METKVLMNFVDDYNDPATGTPCVCLDVTNVGESPTGGLEVMFEYDYEVPQPVSQQTDPQHKRKTTVQALGRRLGFGVAVGQDDGPLAAGQTRLYVFPNKWLTTLQSILASLSPERYRVVISNSGERRPAIPGAEFGDYVQRLLESGE